MTHRIEIQEVSIEEVYPLTLQIPEFEVPYDIAVYYNRLEHWLEMQPQKALILAAKMDNNWVGFKIGYELNEKVFYSWMGGVLPKYRKLGIAKILANDQERWAKRQNYKIVRLKTRNKFKNMLLFAIKNGFKIVDVQAKGSIGDHRIILEKVINLPS